MRVRFKTDGGFAYFPGLSQPVIMDTNELPAKEANELERLIEQAGFFDLPAVSSPSRGAADFLQYTISVTAPEHSHTVRFTDPVKDLHVQALVDFLEKKVAESRTGP